MHDVGRAEGWGPGVSGSGENGSPGEGGREAGEGAGERQPHLRVAVLILYPLLLALPIEVSVDVYTSGAGGARMALCLLCLAAACALQILHVRPAARGGGRRHRAVRLFVQLLLTYVPLIWLGTAWAETGGFLAASMLLLLSRLKWTLFFATVFSGPLIAALHHETVAYVVHLTVGTLVLGLTLYTVSRLARVSSDLVHARTSLAEAVTRERVRFARDLHDLLGYSLSAIALKSEVALRHIPHRHEQAREELVAILRISRQSLTEMRHVANGYCVLSPESELETSTAMLKSAGIEVDAKISAPWPDGLQGTVLAVVLREAMTNILRHSKAEHCSIAVQRTDGRLRMAIRNDGAWQEMQDGASVPPPASRAKRGGLVNLTARLAAVGGALVVGPRPDGWFELAAEVPEAHGPLVPAPAL